MVIVKKKKLSQIIPGEENVGLGDEVRVHEVTHDELRNQVQQEAAAEDLEGSQIRLILTVVAGELQVALELLPGVGLGLLLGLALAVEPDERVIILLEMGLHLLKFRRSV